MQRFYGWTITALAFLTFGLSVGIPYYGLPFFYDYFQKSFGWSRPDITLGFPLAALFTLPVGPLLVHRFSPRLMIIFGTGMTALAFIGFGTMNGSLPVYYALWFVYIIGYIFSGPIPHQLIVSQWFRKKRATAMAFVYLGVGLVGAISIKFIAKPLTEQLGFQNALIVMGLLLLLAWPVAFFFLKDKASDLGLYPDGADQMPAESKEPPKTFGWLLSKPAFWLLLLGSTFSIGSIGSINQNMKFVFKDQGYTDQNALNAIAAEANFWIMISSIAGRLFMGWLADRAPKKWVMLATYIIVAGTIPMLLLVKPGQDMNVYLFSVLFGFGLGADYMLIPLMAAEQFGVSTLARAMAIILPTDTIGQTWFPFAVAKISEATGSYGTALNAVFVMAALGAVAIAFLPRKPQKD
jgi:MFS family permease